MGTVQTESVFWPPSPAAPVVDHRPHMVQHYKLPICAKYVYESVHIHLFIVTLQESRHACEQDDELDGYTWTQYDPREGGVQEIKDSQNNVKITTEFLKVPGGNNGGSWAARIKGEPMDTCESERMDSSSKVSQKVGSPIAKPMHISTVFYSGLEGLGGLEMQNEPVPQVRFAFPGWRAGSAHSSIEFTGV